MMSRERELLARVAFETVHNNGITERLYTEIEAYLAEPVQDPEPVAWIVKRQTYTGDIANYLEWSKSGEQFADPIALYTATPPDAASKLGEEIDIPESLSKSK
jgi:hypothetical protein